MKNFQLEDILESTLEDQNKAIQTSILVTYIMQQKGALSAEKKMSTNEILTDYKNLQKENTGIVFIPENTLANYLSLIARNENYPIRCLGRKQGYFIDTMHPSLNEDSKEETTEEPQNLSQNSAGIKESDLYPFLVTWLNTEGVDKAKDISNKKMMGKWGNPDIVGLRTLDVFKTTYIEITTIEAKRNSINWRHDIFEAVAHTMFSNQSYYAFACKESDIIDKTMISYAQKFNIGILALIVPDVLWNKPLAIEDIEFRVINPAPEQNPDKDTQKEFLGSLGIYDFDTYKKFILS